MATGIDPDLFRDAIIADDVRAYNATLGERLAHAPLWSADKAAAIRAARAHGGGRFAEVIRLPRGVDRTIAGPAGPIRLRVIAPAAAPRGLYLHLHGGGWYMGGADLQDPQLAAIADGANVVCISVDYRLSPEHPYPAAPDDCTAALDWALDVARCEFGVDRVFIGGESSGAHLAVVALLRLRDRRGVTLAGANLAFGFFDLRLTPSARLFGDERYPPRTSDMRRYVAAFIGPDHDVSSPDISPLLGDLRDLCPALFTVGTLDPLLDDTLFMHARWQAAGNGSDVLVYPGGVHSFELGPTAMAVQARQAMIDFVARDHD